VGWLHIPRKAIPFVILAFLILVPPVISQTTTLMVTVSTNKTQYSPAETVSIVGLVRDNQNNAVFGAGVSIQVNGPGNNLIHVQLVYTDQSGAYSDSFILAANSVAGQYTLYVSASKSGYTNAQIQTQFSVAATSTTTSTSHTTTSSSSSSTTTAPKLPMCLIATAAYGSELTPEVTLLRNFRDRDVLRTSAGTSFMQAFNAFYYSFSPQAASSISSNNNLRTVVKAILYPLVGILYLSNTVFTATSFNGELAVTLAGMFASISLGVIYLGPIALVLSRFFKFNRSSRYIRIIQVTCVMIVFSLLGLFLAEIAQLTALMTTTTVGTVLSCFALGSLLLPWLSARIGK